jgi:DNA-binding SARP family transcriptional activator/tetratricopeptide (TPR) repeat protein
VRFGVLGPVEVWDGQRRLPIGGPQQRGLLAVLLLHANQVVSVDRLVDYLWGDQPPATARGLLQGCVAGLRRALRQAAAEDRLETAAPGYRLRVEPGELDLDRFEQLAGEADRAQDPVRAGGLLAQALAVWRGPALDGVDLAGCRPEAAQLAERRLTVLAQRIDVDLYLGRASELVGELPTHIEAHPLWERLRAQLMLALYVTDRRADALDAYQHLRRILIDELGVEPGAPIQHLHRTILAGEDALNGYLRAHGLPAEPAGAPPVPPRPAVPAQLPAAPTGFAGRTRQLKQLDELLTDGERGLRAAIISGMAGAGKTALAVHWAHQVRDRLPDGQLYVNLRGFDASGPAMTPAEALHGFLEALQVPPERIPASVAAQASLYRSLTAGRRMLILLDNAYDAQQVRSLLPGGTGSMVLVTSRHQLQGLVAVEGARPVIVGPLTTVEAHDLLTQRLGPVRVATAPEAVEEIIDRCAGLPLALAIVAARAVTNPDFPVAAIAAELPDAPGARLDALAGEDENTNLRAVFSWSYRALSVPAARLFRLLGLHPGPDLTAPAAASLAGLPEVDTRPPLTELTRAHLVVEHTPGRYALHDLLRAYAAELAQTLESEAEGHAARHRLLDHYLHTALAADRAIDSHREPVNPPRSVTGVVPEDMWDGGHALAWLAAEHRVLVAAVELAGARGFDSHAWHLSWSLANFMQRYGRWHDWAAVQRVALAAASRSGNRGRQAGAHRDLARASILLGRYDEARDHCRHALDLLAELGDEAGQGHTLLIRSKLDGQLEDYRAALHDSRGALAHFRAAGDRRGQALATNNIGWFLTLLGEHEQALPYCEQALTLDQEYGDEFNQAGSWDSLGLIHRHLGHFDEAVTCYERALELIERFGDQYHHALTLVGLGDTYQAAGRPAAARGAWEQAAGILDRVGHPDAGGIRTKISQMAAAGSG